VPDIATHAFLAYFVGFKLPKKFLVIFLLGSVTPDLLTRPFYFFFKDNLFFYLAPLHTPFGLLLFAVLFSQFFQQRFRVFCYFFSGIILHLIMDLFQIKIYPDGYSWLFPFSTRTFNIPLFWPERSLYFLFLLMILFIIMNYKKIFNYLRN
jgi:LexA-binding, inner membrane-associated putative hydrolase